MNTRETAMVTHFPPSPAGDNLCDLWHARTDLACAFRWTARLGMHEAVANHFSLVVDDSRKHFLVNPSGRHFSRIRASDLLLLDANGSPADNAAGGSFDITAWELHSAIHRNVERARCVLHTHPKYATILSCLQDSTLPPIEQNSMRFFERVVVDKGFNGMGIGEEAERVSALANQCPIVLLGNHGLLVVSDSIAQAFDDMYYFERACEIYLSALATGKSLAVVTDEVAHTTREQWDQHHDFANNHFKALKEILNAEEPDYAT